MTGLLTPRVEHVLPEVEIDAGRHRGAVCGREIHAADAAEFLEVLGQALYLAWHVRNPTAIDDRPTTRRDPLLEERLSSGMPHRTTRAPAILREIRADGERLVVERDGVRVLSGREAVRPGRPLAVGRPVELRVPAARPALSPGFFLADGSNGPPHGASILRIYVHVSGPAMVPALWTSALELLEDADVRYRAKIVSASPMFARSDGLVLYLDAGAAQSVVTDLLRLAGRTADVGTATSLFAEPLGDGVAMAWEPSDARRGFTSLSLGEHRARVVAAGLLAHAVSPDAADPATAVAAAMRAANIDPLTPARNLDSPPFPRVTSRAETPVGG
ncbi:T3SS effector HopA1 family protein [Actinoallomurus rhizosphaericola]|uniref:T3SS effector HopA1 family protein n=1 Tax=Actinoallomurus rhizosphaericola TaxID=2952536 RepID=UPI002091F88B|nr:T3SS effector HopA1 family protein [Actinoallomurus rhizosphaericola]MCO5997878.1 T3SS effector HopA1 family protein [Actinoallomurus rhizosphaericola]